MKKNSFIRVLTSRWPVLLSAIVVIIFIFAALFSKWIMPYDPIARDLPNRLAAPSAEHWLGCDLVGRDILSRPFSQVYVHTPSWMGLPIAS